MLKLVTNSFSNGILSPRLQGRSDLKRYYNSISDATNFLVTPQGSLVKRLGLHKETELNYLYNSYFDNVRIIPYQYDTNSGGFIILQLATNDYVLSAEYFSKQDGQYKSVAKSSIDRAFTSLSRIQHKQVGDQIWLTNGADSIILTVSNNNAISFSIWKQVGKPDKVKSFTLAKTALSGNASTIEYAVFASYDGVLSDPVTKSIAINKTWEAGGKITATINLNSDQKFDYIILGKKIAGVYGEIGRWYPEDINNSKIVAIDDNVTPGDAIYRQTNILGDGISGIVCSDCFQQRRVFANAKTQTGSGASIKIPPPIRYLGSSDKVYQGPESDFDKLISVEYSVKVDGVPIASSSITYPENSKYEANVELPTGRVLHILEFYEHLIIEYDNANVDIGYAFDSIEISAKTKWNYMDGGETVEDERAYTMCPLATGLESFSCYEVPSIEKAYAPKISTSYYDTKINGNLVSCNFKGGTVIANDVNTFRIYPNYSISDFEFIVESSVSYENYPMTLWFSEVGNIDNFYSDRPAADDDPFSPTISSTGPAFIRWTISYQEVFLVFTDCGVFSIGFSSNGGFSSATCRISNISKIACSTTVAPVSTEAGVVFVGQDNKTVYTVDFYDNSIRCTNRIITSEHLTYNDPIVSIALQTSPFTLCWIITKSGKALTFTFERNEEVFGWSKCELSSGYKFIDAISISTSTDRGELGSWTDIVFVVESPDGVKSVASMSSSFVDSIGSETPVFSSFTSIVPDSANNSISFDRRNLRDVMVKLNDSDAVEVCGEDEVWVGEKDSRARNRIARIMPRGIVGDKGIFSLRSNSGRCEVLSVQAVLEVE